MAPGEATGKQEAAMPAPILPSRRPADAVFRNATI
jgi:hypothetical protein